MKKLEVSRWKWERKREAGRWGLLFSPQTSPFQLHRRGMSLLVSLFVVSVTSLLLIGILGSETVRLSAVRNTGQSDRAKFLAGAAVHHALALIEADNGWAHDPGEIAATEFPSGSGNSYSATVIPVAGQSGEFLITGRGMTPEVTRVLEVTIKLGG